MIFKISAKFSGNVFIQNSSKIYQSANIRRLIVHMYSDMWWNHLFKKIVWPKSIRVATFRQKQNSLTFHRLFPDQLQFFTDQNDAILRPICLLAANKWQIPFISSLKCTSLILQMKQVKSLNSFLAQNVKKLTSFHSFEQARKKNNTFQVVKIPATTHILGQNYEIPWLFPEFLGI